MKFDSISSSPLPLPLLFLLGIYSLSGLCLLNVNAEVSVQSCPPEIRQTHSLAARAEHDDDDDDDSDDTASPVDSVETVSNHGEPWTDEEDERLIKLREEQRSWTEVAKSFPERTGIALKSRYHRLKKDPSKKSETNKPWNDEEDRKLLDLVETEASWEERALYLPGRSAHAARVRYRYLKRGDSLPKKFRRKFTAKEDELLLKLDEAGIPWKERVAYFKNRPLHSLRYRIRKLKPSKREGPRKFTSKEDDELIEAVRLGMTVEEICELLERNQKAVRRRILILERSNRLDRAAQSSFNRSYTNADFELMRESVEKGMSWRNIAAEHFPGRSYESMNNAYRRYRQRRLSEEEDE